MYARDVCFRGKPLDHIYGEIDSVVLHFLVIMLCNASGQQVYTDDKLIDIP